MPNAMTVLLFVRSTIIRRDMSTTAAPADFWFDPLCPWAWITSRWMKEVKEVRGIETRFHVMSLDYLNEDKDVTEEYRARITKGWAAVRVCIAVAQEFGDDALDRFYTELGTRFHNEGRDKGIETIEEALAAAGLAVELAAAAVDDGYDEAVKKSHHAGIDQVGMEVGTPIVAFDGQAFFGPVVTPIPRGEAAGRLWDGVLLVANTPGFYELKRTRTVRPSFD
jgi:protein-disulfide isomerase-like protein with CxxC motif